MVDPSETSVGPCGGPEVDPVVDPSEISNVGYHLDLTETQARRDTTNEPGSAAVNSGNSTRAPWVPSVPLSTDLQF